MSDKNDNKKEKKITIGFITTASNGKKMKGSSIPTAKVGGPPPPPKKR